MRSHNDDEGPSRSDLEAMKNILFDLSGERPRLQARLKQVSQSTFDDFLYDFDPATMGLASNGAAVAVMVLKPDLKSLYGVECVYSGEFDRKTYVEFIERQIGDTIADRVALIVDDLVWFSHDLSWAAYGSRDTDLVVIGVARDRRDLGAS